MKRDKKGKNKILIMYKVIKNKGTITEAYQLGKESPVIKSLMDDGKIKNLGDGRYEIYSQEAVSCDGGEIAAAGDWVKIDASGFPYPNSEDFFKANHRHINGNTFEQLPKPLSAWDSKLPICPEILFLMEKKGLIINEDSSDRQYEAELWGTKETAAEDAMIVFYSISYDETGKVIDADYNFVGRREFEKTYSML